MTASISLKAKGRDSYYTLTGRHVQSEEMGVTAVNIKIKLWHYIDCQIGVDISEEHVA
jgi:hypothetical protein